VTEDDVRKAILETLGDIVTGTEAARSPLRVNDRLDLHQHSGGSLWIGVVVRDGRLAAGLSSGRMEVCMKRIVLGLAVGIGFSQAAMADWQEDLVAQLLWDLDCTVALISGAMEREIEGERVIIGKVHCEDGRVFDAIRRHELDDFEVTQCTTDEQAC
jgi:hypothetical protein